jgi:hypothetical protein
MRARTHIQHAHTRTGVRTCAHTNMDLLGPFYLVAVHGCTPCGFPSHTDSRCDLLRVRMRIPAVQE